MTRNQHLSYCSVCKNRRFTLKQGFICGLTDKIADFEESCKDFELDKDEKNKRIKEALEKIQKNVKDRYQQFDYLVPDYSDLNSLEFESKTLVLKETKTKKQQLLIYAFLSMVPFLSFIIFNLRDFITNFASNDNNQFTTLSILFLMFLFSFGINSLKSYFRTNKKIKIDEFGITNKKEKCIKWSEILYAYFTHLEHGGRVTGLLHLYPYIGEEKAIDITFLEGSRYDLGLLIYTYMKKVKDN